MRNKLGRIYIISNSINDKKYIGQTVQSLNSRWAGHVFDSSRKNTAIAKAILKYSPENFNIELLEDNIPYAELDKKEIEYIKKYDTVSPNGYNLSHGGQSFKTEEDLQLMSERVKGEKNPMYGKVGELNPFYGKSHTDEYKENSSKRAKEWYDNLPSEEKDKIENRLRKTRMEMMQTIGSGMKGKNHTDDSKNRIREKMLGRIDSNETIEKKRMNSTKNKYVDMVDKDTGEILKTFTSMNEGARYIVSLGKYPKAKGSEISSTCSGNKKTAYGYKWIYSTKHQETIENTSN